MASDCLSRWGEPRWGDARWGEVEESIVIVQGTIAPSATLVRVPNLALGGQIVPTGVLVLPPEWTPNPPPLRPGGYPSETRRYDTGQMTETDQVPTTTREV